MSPEEYIKLYEKYLSGMCSPEEETILMNYRDNFHMQNGEQRFLSGDEKLIKAEIFNKLLSSIDNQKSRSLKTILQWAAAILITIGAGSLFFIHTARHSNKIAYNRNLKPIKPGTTTATLTLANGQSIVLDHAKNGVLASSGNTVIQKLKNGLVTYNNTNSASASADLNALNTISIPRGGQYTITLPDGTNVWLNSKSSLTYPVTFSGTDRKVTLTGEAYFEVAKNKEHPFIVHAGLVDVRVLGTHFNVNAYSDESDVKTTLLEGSVKLSHENSSAVLLPGEQGIAGPLSATIQTKKVNVSHVIAWKNGYFIFKGQKIDDIMRQISRWYDVDVEYKGSVPGETFGGIYSRNKDINELLNGLELTGLIHFKIEGRRIIVMD